MSLLIAGTHSGCGKSTITLGVLAALKKLGLTVQPFKSGPDFIDPGLHSIVAGRISRNLDLWICGPEYVRTALARHSSGADAVIIEGVMGLYDGAERSSASLAQAVGANVILVVDAYGMAESAGAIVQGFNSYGIKLAGVIFNRVGSPSHYKRLLASVGNVEALGYLPRDVQFTIPERHLGLHTAQDNPISAGALEALAEAIIAHMDIARIAELARPAITDSLPSITLPKPKVRIGIARDQAFCFYYEDNLDMLMEAGAGIVPFSPIKDKTLPDGIDAIYIGGGYPELYAKELAENTYIREEIKNWVLSGRPLYAECGGLMYMGQGILSDEGRYPMSGAFPYECRLLKRRSALGYREVRVGADSILGPEGAILRGHEFHYSHAPETVLTDGVKYNVMEESGTGVSSAQMGSALVSYTHVHFGSRPDSARHFVDYIETKGATWKR